MGYLTDLTDEQWTWVVPILPATGRSYHRRTVNLRRVIDALRYIERSGCQWPIIALDVKASGTVGCHFDKRNGDGAMLEIHDGLRSVVPSRGAADVPVVGRQIILAVFNCTMGSLKIAEVTLTGGDIAFLCNNRRMVKLFIYTASIEA